jgi:hypothetical protein
MEVWSLLSSCPRSSLPAKMLVWLAAHLAPWGTEMRSCSSSVLVQETAEQAASVDSGWWMAADEGHSSGWIRRLKLQRPVGAMSVVVRDVHLEGPLQVPAPHDQ